MIVKGHDVLRWPHADMAAFKANPNMTGVPFMGPWINRLDEQAFYANGKRISVRHDARQRARRDPDSRIPDGTDQWQVVSVKADEQRRG